MTVEHVFADEAAVLFVLFYCRIVLVDDYAVFVAYCYRAVKLFCPVWYHFQLFLIVFTKLVTFSILLKKIVDKIRDSFRAMYLPSVMRQRRTLSSRSDLSSKAGLSRESFLGQWRVILSIFATFVV